MNKRKARLIILAKKIIIICLLFGMLGTLTTLNAHAKTGNNVTAKYKKTITKLLRNFDSYLGRGCKRDVKVKFDIYAKSTMAYLAYTGHSSIYEKDLKYVRKKLKRNMDLYFGTSAPVRFKKNTIKHACAIAYSNPPNLVQNVNGVIRYVGGDWDENALPKGYVTSIRKKNGKKYEVTYRIMWYDFVKKKIADPCEYTSYTKEMGVYRVSLKKAHNKYGFIITGIKRVRSNIDHY